MSLTGPLSVVTATQRAIEDAAKKADEERRKKLAEGGESGDDVPSDDIRVIVPPPEETGDTPEPDQPYRFPTQQDVDKGVDSGRTIVVEEPVVMRGTEVITERKEDILQNINELRSANQQLMEDRERIKGGGIWVTEDGRRLDRQQVLNMYDAAIATNTRGILQLYKQAIFQHIRPSGVYIKTEEGYSQVDKAFKYVLQNADTRERLELFEAVKSGDEKKINIAYHRAYENLTPAEKQGFISRFPGMITYEQVPVSSTASTVSEKEAIRSRWSGEQGWGEWGKELARYTSSAFIRPQALLENLYDVAMDIVTRPKAQIDVGTGITLYGPALPNPYMDETKTEESILSSYASHIQTLEQARLKEGVWGVFKESYKPGGFGFTATIAGVAATGIPALTAWGSSASAGVGGKIISEGIVYNIIGGTSAVMGADIGYTAAVEPESLGKKIGVDLGYIALMTGVGYAATRPVVFSERVDTSINRGVSQLRGGYKSYFQRNFPGYESIMEYRTKGIMSPKTTDYSLYNKFRKYSGIRMFSSEVNKFVEQGRFQNVKTGYKLEMDVFGKSYTGMYKESQLTPLYSDTSYYGPVGYSKASYIDPLSGWYTVPSEVIGKQVFLEKIPSKSLGFKVPGKGLFITYAQQTDTHLMFYDPFKVMPNPFQWSKTSVKGAGAYFQPTAPGTYEIMGKSMFIGGLEAVDIFSGKAYAYGKSPEPVFQIGKIQLMPDFKISKILSMGRTLEGYYTEGNQLNAIIKSYFKDIGKEGPINLRSARWINEVYNPPEGIEHLYRQPDLYTMGKRDYIPEYLKISFKPSGEFYKYVSFGKQTGQPGVQQYLGLGYTEKIYTMQGPFKGYKMDVSRFNIAGETTTLPGGKTYPYQGKGVIYDITEWFKTSGSSFDTSVGKLQQSFNRLTQTTSFKMVTPTKPTISNIPVSKSASVTNVISQAVIPKGVTTQGLFLPTVNITKSVSESITKQITKPVVEPVIKSILEPLTKAIVEPMTKTIVKPMTKTIVEPITKSITKPVTKQIIKPVLTPLITPVITPTIRPPTIPKTPTPPIIPGLPRFLLGEPGQTEQQEGYHVFVKSRQYYKGKPRGAEKYRLLTNKSFNYSDAMSLMGSAIDNSIAQQGYIKPSGKPASSLHKVIPSRWDRITMKFDEHNGKYLEKREYAIDTWGESHDLNVYRWYQQQPVIRKSDRRTSPVFSIDMYRFDDMNNKINRGFRRMRTWGR